MLQGTQDVQENPEPVHLYQYTGRLLPDRHGFALQFVLFSDPQ